MTAFPRKEINPWLVLTIGAVVAFMASGIRTSYGVFVVPLEQSFGLTRSQTVMPFSLSMVIWGVAQPFTGAYMDSKGPRKAILLAILFMAFGFVATAGAQNLLQLILGYGIPVGVAASGLNVASFSLLITKWVEQKRGMALGYVLAGIPMGALAFSPLSAALIIDWNWRGTFLILAATMVMVAFPLTWFFLREPAEARTDNPTGVSMGDLLFNNEIRQAVKSRAYWILMVKYFGCGLSGSFFQAHLPAIALDRGISFQEGANALGLIGAGGAVGAVLGGLASDRFGRLKSMAVGYFLRAVGIFVLAFAASDVTSFYVFSVVAGMPVFFTISITQLVIYEIFGPGIAGRMIGLTFVLHQVGSTLGPFFGGWMFEANGNYMLALVIVGGVLCNSAYWSWRLLGASRIYIGADVGL
jgi:MFS family permease